jgi:hypothetical protein
VEELIEITQKEYKSLLKSKDELQALEDGGVDNWSWYGESLEAFRESVNRGEYE